MGVADALMRYMVRANLRSEDGEKVIHILDDLFAPRRIRIAFD